VAELAPIGRDIAATATRLACHGRQARRPAASGHDACCAEALVGALQRPLARLREQRALLRRELHKGKQPHPPGTDAGRQPR
jgi:hypothetical protein